MSFKCLILSRRSTVSDCSSLDLNRSSNQVNPHIWWRKEEEFFLHFPEMCSQVKYFSNWGWQTLVKKWLQHSDWFVAYNSKNALTPPWVQMSNECQTLFLTTENNFNLMCSYMFFQSFHPQTQLHWWRLCDSVKSSEQKLESGPWVGIVLSYWCLLIWTSFLYLLAKVASVVSVSSNKRRRCSLSCSFFWSWLFSCEKNFFFHYRGCWKCRELIFCICL